ncbi:IclR family transcriptional regulator [Nocardia vinacea]|uniref:IclR family transcriptional regulator n=1 Tax=Nocardia vinacea TaxID=96468 RepID=A0ABZ1YU15_9NOCA|nr:IclR family transcriptional regulator [Nocardia vinacea]
MVDADPPPSILSKAFDVLRAFNANERVMTLTELSEASGLAKSTVHRLLARLIELGAIEHHRSGYRISIEIFRLGVTTPAASMRDVAISHLAALHRQTGQTIHLGILRQFEVIFLERLSADSALPVLTGVGGRIPANCTALGKALLAYEDLEDLESFLPNPMRQLTAASITQVPILLAQLTEIRRTGLARERGELQPGLACTAVPIIVNGFAVGAVSITQAGTATFDPRWDRALRESAVLIAREVRTRLAEGRAHWFPKEM